MRAAADAIHALAVGIGAPELGGGTVDTAEDLLGALAHLADGDVDVVLASLELPDGRGPDVIRSILERSPDVPVIALADERDAPQAMEAGAVDVVPLEGGEELVARAVRYAVALHRMQVELRRRETVDDLTGLPNRRGFERLAEHHLALAARARTPLALLLVRIGGLEAAGEPARGSRRDAAVVETAEVLRTSVRDSDVLSRLDAGAFCVLLTGEPAGAESLVLARMVDAVAAHNARTGRTSPLRLSIGAATYDPEHPASLEELISAAESGGAGRGEPA